MAYDIFTKSKVFSVESVNVACNRLINNLYLLFSEEVVKSSFCITGNLARAINREEVSVNCVPFITDNEEIFKHLIANLDKIMKGSGKLCFADRIQYQVSGAYVEIWFSETSLNVDAIDGLYCQTIEDIPENIF